MEIAAKKRLLIKYKATVMGGSPFINVLTGLKAVDVLRIYGILNATTNYVLTYMHEHLVGLEEALEHAKTLGVAEKNPVYDIEGIDAAAKLVIISNTLGVPVKLGDITRKSLKEISLRNLMDAIRRGEVIKYIAYLNLEEKITEVSPRRIKSEDRLASINGLMNAVVIGHEYGDLFFSGKGGGCRETASMVLDDILSISLKEV